MIWGYPYKWLKPLWLAHMYFRAQCSLGALELVRYVRHLRLFVCLQILHRCCWYWIRNFIVGFFLAWHWYPDNGTESRISDKCFTEFSLGVSVSMLRLNSTTLGACTLNLHNLNWVSGCSVPPDMRTRCSRSSSFFLRSMLSLVGSLRPLKQSQGNQVTTHGIRQKDFHPSTFGLSTPRFFVAGILTLQLLPVILKHSAVFCGNFWIFWFGQMSNCCHGTFFHSDSDGLLMEIIEITKAYCEDLPSCRGPDLLLMAGHSGMDQENTGRWLEKRRSG